MSRCWTPRKDKQINVDLCCLFNEIHNHVYLDENHFEMVTMGKHHNQISIKKNVTAKPNFLLQIFNLPLPTFVSYLLLLRLMYRENVWI